MTKSQFDTQLQSIKVAHSDWRPFLCDGHPFDAEVFIIGLNPATPGLPNWSTFWQPQTGFDLKSLREVNMEFRQGQSSATQNRLDRLKEGIGLDISYVETNLYPIASKKLKLMPPIGKTDKHLNLLLSACSPKVIYVHGAETCMWIAKKYGIALKSSPARGRYVGPISLLGSQIVAFFSYQASLGPGYEDLTALGRNIRAKYL